MPMFENRNDPLKPVLYPEERDERGGSPLIIRALRGQAVRSTDQQLQILIFLTGDGRQRKMFA